MTFVLLEGMRLILNGQIYLYMGRIMEIPACVIRSHVIADNGSDFQMPPSMSTLIQAIVCIFFYFLFLSMMFSIAFKIEHMGDIVRSLELIRCKKILGPHLHAKNQME